MSSHQIIKDHLLVELGCEELPSQTLLEIKAVAADAFSTQLKKYRLEYESLSVLISPRRIAIVVSQLVDQQKTIYEKRLGPALKAAYDTLGKPTKAALGFAKSCQVSIDQLKVESTPKGDRLACDIEIIGQPLSALLEPMMVAFIQQFSSQKRMRWNAQIEPFMRPVRWLVTLYGSRLIPIKLMGLRAGYLTYGHRFLASAPLRLNHACDYQQQLQKAFVLPCFETRKQWIQEQVSTYVTRLNAKALLPASLLNEIASLVEFPNAILCRFEQRFLELPKAVLVTSMQQHQKYIPLEDQQGQLMTSFLVISHMDQDVKGLIKLGNERVIRPRLADALFFYHQDRQQPLIDYVPQLKQIVWHHGLGSLYDKVQRLKVFVGFIASQLNVELPAEWQTIVLCSKADITTQLVKEFPSLQGIIGAVYAAQDGVSEVTANAIESHYHPIYQGDDVPNSSFAAILSIADRLDHLVGGFITQQQPNADKDPLALRRAAANCLRICHALKFNLDFQLTLEMMSTHYASEVSSKLRREVICFINARLPSILPKAWVQLSLLQAVKGYDEDAPFKLYERLSALAQFADTEHFEHLIQVAKRVRNFISKLSEDQMDGDSQINSALFESKAEDQLYNSLIALIPEIESDLEKGFFYQGLARLTQIRPVIDTFFETVMILCDQVNIQRNRIYLLIQLNDLILKFADFSALGETH